MSILVALVMCPLAAQANPVLRIAMGELTGCKDYGAAAKVVVELNTDDAKTGQQHYPTRQAWSNARRFD